TMAWLTAGLALPGRRAKHVQHTAALHASIVRGEACRGPANRPISVALSYPSRCASVRAYVDGWPRNRGGQRPAPSANLRQFARPALRRGPRRKMIPMRVAVGDTLTRRKYHLLLGVPSAAETFQTPQSVPAYVSDFASETFARRSSAACMGYA